MTETASTDEYGVLTEPTTLTIQRLLPGPIERVWAYLTESDLRRQWFAAGKMEMRTDSTCELVWRNEELSNPPSKRPDGFDAESRLQIRIIDVDVPRTLSFTFGNNGRVTFALEPRGSKVLLTVTHRDVPSRSVLLKVSGGWHMHLDVLVARMNGEAAPPFWDGWRRLNEEYDRRLPA